MTPPRDISYIDGTPNWTDRTVHFNRLLRDGWRLLENTDSKTLWERPHPDRSLTLRMSQTWQSFELQGGPYVVEYALRDADSTVCDLGTATWADWDQHGRLVLARDGKLFAWISTDGLIEIADFNDQKPQPEPAPDWAKQWPQKPQA